MINMKRELEDFAMRYHFAADDPELQDKYEFIMKNQSAVQTRLNVARKEGLERGMEQGLERGRDQGLEEGISAGAAVLAATYREFGLTREEAVQRLVTQLRISQQEAERYVDLQI